MTVPRVLLLLSLMLAVPVPEPRQLIPSSGMIKNEWSIWDDELSLGRRDLLEALHIDEQKCSLQTSTLKFKDTGASHE